MRVLQETRGVLSLTRDLEESYNRLRGVLSITKVLEVDYRI